MALANSEWLRGSRFYRRIGSVRLALGAVALVMGALWLFGALAALPAIAAFVVIATVILLSAQNSPPRP